MDLRKHLLLVKKLSGMMPVYNIFYGNDFFAMLKDVAKEAEKGIATVFGCYVNDP